MTEINLTEEQKRFIAECEEEFKYRFTDKDDEFSKLKTNKLKDPPIMDPWYNNPPRNFDWSRQNQGHHDQGGGGGGGGGGRRNQGWKRRHDRYGSDRDHYNNYKRNY